MTLMHGITTRTWTILCQQCK